MLPVTETDGTMGEQRRPCQKHPTPRRKPMAALLWSAIGSLLVLPDIHADSHSTHLPALGPAWAVEAAFSFLSHSFPPQQPTESHSSRTWLCSPFRDPCESHLVSHRSLSLCLSHTGLPVTSNASEDLFTGNVFHLDRSSSYLRGSVHHSQVFKSIPFVNEASASRGSITLS